LARIGDDMTMIDDAAEKERLRRQEWVRKIRAANDSAPRPKVSAIAEAKRRERERAGIAEPEGEPHRFEGIATEDLTGPARISIMAEGRRNASAAGTKAGDDNLIFKTRGNDDADDDAGDDGLIRKTVYSEPVQTTADADWSASWNEWADSRIRAVAADREDVIELAAATRQYAEAVDKRLDAMDAQLHALIDLLRAEHVRPVDLPNPLSRRVN
jgi:hypothetical protein